MTASQQTLLETPFEILLVEDLWTDATLIQRALKKGGVVTPIKWVRDGQEALDYMLKQGQYQSQDDYPMPGIVLLDLKLPKVNGFEVLKKLKNTEKLRRIPVVVLTSSDQTNDIDTAYDIGANSYLVKPVTLSAFIEVASKIKLYWLLSNKSPTS